MSKRCVRKGMEDITHGHALTPTLLQKGSTAKGLTSYIFKIKTPRKKML